MWDTLYSKMNFEDKIGQIIESNLEGQRTIKFRRANKETIFKIYSVFKGVFIMFSNVNIKECSSIFKYNSNLLLVNYCKDGKVEYKKRGRLYDSLKAGEIKISTKDNKDEKLVFPSGKYSGVTIIFETNIIDEELSGILNNFSKRVLNIKKKYCQKSNSCKLSGNESIEYIFSRIYEVPSKIQDEYFKIKILEMLLYLETYEINGTRRSKQYFSKSQVEKMKLIHDFLTENISQVYTIDDLCERFSVSPTSLKECFKMLYGEPIFSYMRSYRINYAAQILRSNEIIKIIDVAGMVGYDSPSKFSAAFKKKKGLCPRDYRKYFTKIKL